MSYCKMNALVTTTRAKTSALSVIPEAMPNPSLKPLFHT